jgi:hypothetical protein
MQVAFTPVGGRALNTILSLYTLHLLEVVRCGDLDHTILEAKGALGVV